MSYIGTAPTIGNFQVCDAISTVNGQASYTMLVGGVNATPQSANHMLVSLNGILQKAGSSFTVSGSTITFASNLVTGDVIDFIQILGNVLDLGVPSDSTVSLAKLTATGTKDATTFLRGDNTFASPQGVYESQLLHIRDEKSNNTHGGTFTSGAWQQRDLNTIKTNEITGASLSSSNITLPSGTYYIEASAPASEVGAHKSKLYNTTDSSDVIIGTNKHNRSDNNYAVSTSDITGRFTISAEKVFMIAHRCATSRSTDGFGIASNFSVIEVYSDVKIWKVA